MAQFFSQEINALLGTAQHSLQALTSRIRSAVD
jgi:hypothetical protein